MQTVLDSQSTTYNVHVDLPNTEVIVIYLLYHAAAIVLTLTCPHMLAEFFVK